MSADIVNLNKARKARKRGAAEAQAGENRVRFGRTKAERDADAAGERDRNQQLDNARRSATDNSGKAEDDDGGLDPGSVS